MKNADKKPIDHESSEVVKKKLNHEALSEDEKPPSATGVGAVGGALAGAVLGSVGGPVGLLVGGAVGAAAGATVGHMGGETLNPLVEDDYWREKSVSQPYYQENFDYDRDYSDAYRLGYESLPTYGEGVKFEDVESDLKLKWEQIDTDSRLNWEQARLAIKDAWSRTHS